jgi:hypothetical protein
MVAAFRGAWGTGAWGTTEPGALRRRLRWVAVIAIAAFISPMQAHADEATAVGNGSSAATASQSTAGKDTVAKDTVAKDTVAAPGSTATQLTASDTTEPVSADFEASRETPTEPRTVAGTVEARTDGSPINRGTETTLWSFRPMTSPAIPEMRSSQSSARAVEPIDRFLLERLEETQLTFAPPVSAEGWLRRVTFDLIGLPPSPEEMDEFVANEHPAARDQALDRLLADPRYGETWGRMWLDLVRYAETAGFNADPTRPLAYKYRDYVVRALNADKPYDRFVSEQLAGDELAPEDPDAWAATGYNRMWPDESNASNILLARQLALNDLTSNVGTVFLGLSIGCAQCHDHKFDPLLQSDFYQLQAYFAGVVLEDQVPQGRVEQLREYVAAEREWIAQTADLRQELAELTAAAKVIATSERRRKFPAEVLAALDTPPDDRSPLQRQWVFWTERQISWNEQHAPWWLDDFQRLRFEELQQQWRVAEAQRPQPPARVAAMATREVSSDPPATYLLAAGSYDSPLEEVFPDVPVVLRGTSAAPPPVSPVLPSSSGRRSALAAWLTHPEHPLTYRVLVNRLWQGHFGRGLVETSNDFGVQAAPVSHPRLLDWLSREFLRREQSWKAMHRQMLRSAAYGQSSVATAEQQARGQQADPGNVGMWRFPRQRLTAERIRDAWLSMAGQLNDEMFGHGVRPEMPVGMHRGWEPSESPRDRTRRSIYIFAKRNLPYPLLQAFDLPDMHESCGCRSQTVIAPQALLLWNEPVVQRAAAGMAARAIRSAPSADREEIADRLGRLVFGRDPTKSERSRWLAFVDEQSRLAALPQATTPPVATEEQRSAALQGAGKSDPGLADVSDVADREDWVGWHDLAHVLLNSNEFLYVD